MTLYRMQVALQDISGLARDEYVNSFWIHWPAEPSPTAMDALQTAVTAFYDRLSAYFSPGVRQNGHTMKLYQHGLPLDSPPVRQWVWNFGFLPGTSGTQAYPGEVAACLTFHGIPAPGPGRFPQSWRGRVYLGPLCGAAAGTATPGTARPSDIFRQAVIDSAVTLSGDIAAGAVLALWVIYSRKLNMMFEVATVGCDDAWDTQRSRGLKPTKTGNTAVGHAVQIGVPAG